MAQGHMLHTDFSGQGCVEQCYRMMDNACRQLGILLPNTWTQQHRACDNSKLCQNILQDGHQAAHIFTDIRDRLPGAHRDTLQGMRPKMDSAGNPVCHVEARRAYARMAKYLCVHAASCFGPDKKGRECLLHPHKQCPVSAPTQPSSPSAMPLRTVVAGTMCTPWFNFGKQSGWSHPHTESHLIWAEDCKHGDYHLATLENSEYFPLNTWREKMSPECITVDICVCPSMLGWPCRRLRLYATAINQKHLIWLGPAPGKALAEHFMSLFSRKVMVEGDVFVGIDSEVKRDSARRAMATCRGIFGGEYRIQDTFSPDMKRRLSLHTASQTDSTGLGGTCLVDLSQNPAKRQRSGPWFGAFAQSSKFASLTALPVDHRDYPYIFTPAEIAFVNGWPTISEVNGQQLPFHSSLPSVFKNLTFHQHSSVVGNGMHLHTMAAWLLYVQSHCVRRELLDRWAPRAEASLLSSMPAEEG